MSLILIRCEYSKMSITFFSFTCTHKRHSSQSGRWLGLWLKLAHVCPWLDLVCVCKKFENCYHLSIDVIDDHLILVTARTTKNEVSSYSWQKTPRKSSLRRKDCVSDSVVLYKHLTSKNAGDFMCHRFEKCSFTKTIELESQLGPATDSLRI